MKTYMTGLIGLLFAVQLFAGETASTVATFDFRDYTLGVASGHGTPVPSIGTHSDYCWNSSVTCSVDSAVSEGGTNYTSTGWSGTGSVPTAGTTNNTNEITLTNISSSITWNWDAQANGSDTDGDGMNDAWEMDKFGNLDQPADGDFDTDGRTNAQEEADGTDPTNPGSTLGLVAYYPFDGDADDATTNGNHGTAINTLLATNRFGLAEQAFDFNGSAYVSVSSQPDLLFEHGFTTVAWIKTSHTRGGVATQNSPAGGNYRYGIDNSGQFLFSTNPTEHIYSSAVNDNVWHQLVGVYDDVTQTILHYIDGVLVLSVDGIGPAGLDSGMELIIGDENQHNWKFIGLIDDVRIYNRAISSNEVARLYTAPNPDSDSDGMDDAWEMDKFGNLDQSADGDYDADGRTNAEEEADGTDPTNPGSTLGLVAYYPFDGDATDATTNGNDATLNGFPDYAVDRFGVSSNACSFDGIDDYIYSPASLNLGQAEYTINQWIQMDPEKVGQSLFDSNPHYGFGSVYNDPNSGSNNLSIWIGTGATGGWVSSPVIGSEKSFDSNAWHMVTFRKSGDDFFLLIDGVTELSNTVDSSTWNKMVQLQFGKISYEGSWYDQFMFKGAMDEVRIYDRALSSNEVARLYGAAAAPTNTPLAEAGADANCFIGQTVVFDGSTSDNATNFVWEIISAPSNSIAELLGAATASPSLTPDQAGVYEIQLVVDDGTLFSEPDTVEVTASWINWIVESAHGTPVPSLGTNLVEYGTVLTNSVEAAVTNGGTLYACSGATVEPPEGGTTNLFTNLFISSITNHGGVVWSWATNYWMDVAVSGSGTVSVAAQPSWSAPDTVGAFEPAGSSPVLSAEPDAGWLFMGWSGDLAGGYTQSNAVLLVDAPKSVTATFSDDADGDGLLNTNETAIGTDPRNGDSDGDGIDDGFEVGQGLSPTNSNTVLIDYMLTNKAVFGFYTEDELGALAVGDLMIGTSNGTANLWLQLWKSDDLQSWTNAGDAVLWQLPADEGKQFYKVQAGE